MNKHNSSNSNSHSSSGLGLGASSSLGGVGSGGAGGNDSSSSSSPSTGGGGGITDVRMEDGKLFYQKRWFRRGQAVQVEPKHGDKFPGMISAIGSEAIWVRKTMDNTKIRIYLTQLAKGKFVLKRRAA